MTTVYEHTSIDHVVTVDGVPPTDQGRTDGLSITAAAQALGTSRDAVRQRIRRGTMEAYKAGGQWFVVIDQPGARPGRTSSTSTRGDVRMDRPPDSSTDRPPNTAPNAFGDTVPATELVEQMRSEITWLRDQLRAEQGARRREVSELHVLLQRSQQYQASLAAPASAADPATAMAAQRRRRWWWPW